MLLVIGAVSLTGCASLGFAKKAVKLNKNATAGYIPPNYITDINFQLSTGAFIFDASKRMGIYSITKENKTFDYKYLSEEQPDAIYETLKEFLAEVTADIKNNDTNLTAKVETMSNIDTTTNSCYHFCEYAHSYHKNKYLYTTPDASVGKFY